MREILAFWKELANRKNPPNGVSFSDFICTFAKSFRVSFIIKCNTKISEISDMAKSYVHVILYNSTNISL